MSDAAASAAAAPAPAPAPPRPSSASSGQGRRYTVLAGSFGKSENAERLREKFLAAGLDVQVNEVTVNNKKYFRVMSGTFDDQASAEAYGRELKQRDLVDSAYIKPM
ncbi:MAG: SPOR domain-containing protein [Deltaproteobacteria bacterium]|nr:SPOR domain-containing protein [Deltaproteobacteria bacterium]